MKNPPANYHVMIKPCGAQCNLDCTYCYYLHKSDLLAQPKNPRMNFDVLETHIRTYCESQTGSDIVFSWQGGEPMLMGIAFFQRALALQKRYKRPEQRIENDLQTNGLLLDDEWCAFLKENNFLVGLSVDGPDYLHDAYRRTKSGQPSFNHLMRAVERLHKFAIPFHALCVVNRQNSRAPLAVYRFLRDEVRPRLIQFIPCVEPQDFRRAAPQTWDENPLIDAPETTPDHAQVTYWSLAPTDWGDFLCQIWDDWLANDVGRVFIDAFEEVIAQLFNHGAQKCLHSPSCGQSLALEHDGSLYSCDHFVYPEFKLGSILKTPENALAFNAQQRKFANDKAEKLPRYCRQCDYLRYCWGECPKNRFVKTPEGEPGLNYLCPSFKLFYKKALSAKATIESILRAQNKSGQS